MDGSELEVLKGWSGVAPLFPLPSTVFFPQTTLPLHVFESRYRQMVEDASEGEGLIAVSLLRGDWKKDYAGSPAIHSIATIGQMQNVERLSDGRYNMQLVGLARVRLSELPSERLYRIANMTLEREADPSVESDALSRLKLDLQAAHAYLLSEMTDGEHAAQLMVDESLPFEEAVNNTCARLPIEAEVRQRLLELDDVADRGRTAQRLIGDLLQKVLQLKSTLTSDDTAVN